MAHKLTEEQVRTWIDDDLVEDIESIPDEATEFNLAVEMSNTLLHDIRRRPDGPLLVG